MNLFRSEHAMSRSSCDLISEEAIMPLADWALAFSGSMCRDRLAPDILARRGEYLSELFQALEKLGTTGDLWRPE